MLHIQRGQPLLHVFRLKILICRSRQQIQNILKYCVGWTYVLRVYLAQGLPVWDLWCKAVVPEPGCSSESSVELKKHRCPVSSKLAESHLWGWCWCTAKFKNHESKELADGIAFTILKTTKFKNDHAEGSQKRNEQVVLPGERAWQRLVGRPLHVLSRVSNAVFMIVLQSCA